MTKWDADALIDRLIKDEISVEDIKRLIKDSKKETRGRKKKIILEDPEYRKNLNDKTRIEKNLSIWAYWIRLEPIKNIPQMEKRRLIAKLLNVGEKRVDREITEINKLRENPEVVIKVTNNSIVIDTEEGIRHAQFAHKLGLDLLNNYHHIELSPLRK